LFLSILRFRHHQLSGAASVSGIDTLKGEDLHIVASGASDVRLLTKYNNIHTKASGASEIILSGYSTSQTIEASGASLVTAKALKTESTIVKASGASSCFVNATTDLTYQVSGASDVSYVDKPETVIVENSKGTEKVVIIRDSTKTSSYYNYRDTTSVNVGSLNIEVVEGDTTKVSVGNHTLIVDDDGNVKWKRNKKKRFNGHWGGVELGINGYITPDFNTNWGSEYDYLNLRYEKSIAVNLNIYEQNIALNKDKNMGIVTGIGMAWNNYRFSPPTYLSPDSAEVYGFYMENVSVRKTKLTVMYITVPIMFEIQTKNPKRLKRFHFGIGGLISARVSSHTKIYFDEANKEYQLYDPKTESYVPGTYKTPNANERNIVKNFNSFYMQPFKFDGMVRIGYSVINVFATYSLNTFFQSNRGPELNAWTIGITLVGW